MHHFHRPGQALICFQILRPLNVVTERGRIRQRGDQIVEHICAVLAQADPKQKEQWKQQGHPISHVIVQELRGVTAQTGDILLYRNQKFEVQGCQNPGELNHYMLYYCMERLDKNG